MTIIATLHQPQFVQRTLNLKALVTQKSHLLLGPRQTGKSSLIRETLAGTKVYNLLETETYLALTQSPALIRQELSAADRWIVIDEIQRIPELLNEVQLIIEEKRVHFILTGSSARKLRRGGVNLLGERARTKHLHPLTSHELGTQFDLGRCMQRQLLPSIYFSDDPAADLRAYVGSYLLEEVVAEGATRNVPAFCRFLKIAAMCNSTVINFTNLANDVQVPRTTVYEYFEILKDTLILQELPAYLGTRKRRGL